LISSVSDSEGSASHDFSFFRIFDASKGAKPYKSYSAVF
jgi:hypothetical protein